MSHELELNKANRLRIAHAFRHNKRVDFSIDCVIEGQMGKAFVDDPAQPTCYRITIGPFWYFAGEARNPGAHHMMKEFPRYSLLMPSPSGWMDLANEIYAGYLQPFSRYTFSAASLSSQHLTTCLEESGHRARIVPLDVEIASRLASQPDAFLELSDFESVQDFIGRGIGYAALDGGNVMGVAYSSLVCSAGIEVSVFIEEPYRQKGVATALGSRLLLDCLEQGLRPNWDAANPESCKLAKRLGFSFVETYDSYYHVKE